MDASPRVILDGLQIAHPDEESGFDAWADVCPGFHLLELDTGKGHWTGWLDIPGPGRFAIRLYALKDGIAHLKIRQHRSRTP